jgi:hypothetical protein
VASEESTCSFGVGFPLEIGNHRFHLGIDVQKVLEEDALLPVF